MKINPFPTLWAGLTALLLLPAWALEAPADNASPPPAAAGGGRVAAAAAPQPAAKPASAFLGVVVAAVPAMLAEHLGLKAGEGIVVQALVPDGPAAKAGVAVHDVITRVADHPVGSPVDLTQQVAARKPGETIRLMLIHQGKPAAIEVALGPRPDGVTAHDAQPLEQLNLEGLPKDLADRVRGAIQGNLGGMDLDAQEDGAEVAPQIQEAMRAMQKRLKDAVDGMNVPAPPGEPRVDVQQGATIRLMDEQGSIEMKSNEGGKEVTLRDKDNKITWSGPWDTEQDKAAAPQDARQRVERFNIDSKDQGGGLRLRLRGQPNE